MVNSLTNKPLIVLVTRDGEMAYKESSMREYTENKPKDAYSLREVSTSEGLIRYTNIAKVRNATELEYFFYFVKKWEIPVESHILRQLTGSLSALSDKQKKSLTLKQILEYIKRKREEDRYYGG